MTPTGFSPKSIWDSWRRALCINALASTSLTACSHPRLSDPNLQRYPKRPSSESLSPSFMSDFGRMLLIRRFAVHTCACGCSDVWPPDESCQALVDPQTARAAGEEWKSLVFSLDMRPGTPPHNSFLVKLPESVTDSLSATTPIRL